MAVSHSEIIDLTGDSPEPIAPTAGVISEGEVEVGDTVTRGELHTKRLRKNQKNKHCTTDESSNSRRWEEEHAMDRGEGPSKQKRKRSPTSASDDKDLFFIDLTPVAFKSSVHITPSTNISSTDESKLLVPAHVQVFGSLPVEIITASDLQGEDSDFIEYLDFDSSSRKGIARYYVDPDEKASKTRGVCKNCGAEGEHTTVQCRVVICLTCGARNEHTTRSCPISKTCFTCSMKGHLSSACPNRHTYHNMNTQYLCRRCGFDTHMTSECPTWWRMYEYVTEDVHKETISKRRKKAALPLGQGGEGYIAEDEWCYNCGLSGHWGDSCTASRPVGVPEDGSAFHERNIMTGPFSEVGVAAKNVARRDFRDWEKSDDNFIAGQAGKQKAKYNLEKKQRDLDATEHSWFDNQHQRRHTAAASLRANGSGGNGNRKNSKKLTFGSIQMGQPFMHGPRQEQNLLNRISSGPSSRRENRSVSKDNDRDGNSQGSRGNKRPRQSDPNPYVGGRYTKQRKDRDDRGRDHNGHRPQYKGDYSR